MCPKQRFHKDLRLSVVVMPAAADAPSAAFGISHTGQAGGRHRPSIADKRARIG
jgi:hypothetical protein